MYVCIPNMSLYMCIKFVLCKCVVQAKNIEMKHCLVFLISGNKTRQVPYLLGTGSHCSYVAGHAEHSLLFSLVCFSKCCH
jgi:hypothetical protein